MINEIETRKIMFSGRVQGVGFRWATAQLAGKHPVGGHVKNLPDGRVELLVQGQKEVIERLRTDIVDHFEGNISDLEEILVESTTRFSEFLIKR